MKRTAALFSTTIALAGALIALSGCASSPHQIIGPTETCASCHSDDKATFEQGDAAPAQVAESGPSVTVKADAPSIVVCSPTFAAEDGSYFVPVERKTVAVENGEAVLELEDGLWALCIDEGDTARAKLVSVDSSKTEAAVVEL